jgi:hypothetical protein
VRALAGLALLALIVGCTAAPRVPPPVAQAPAPPPEADRLVREAERLREVERLAQETERAFREADAQLAGGNPAAAVRILDRLVRQSSEPPVHDRALYELARAEVLAANGSRDYRQPAAHLDRLLREHPASRYATDARALRIVLGAYVTRTAELDRLLERLRAIDLEFERPRQP